jgi:hypothetical protein
VAQSNRIDCHEGTISSNAKPRLQSVVTTIDQSFESLHFYLSRIYQGYFFHTESGKSMGIGVFRFTDIISKTMPVSGPCTKCIISHAIFPSKLLLLSTLFLLQQYLSGLFRSERSSSNNPSHTVSRAIDS